MNLVICDDLAHAQALSRGLYLLSRPAGVAASAGDQTSYAVGWRQHPTDGRWAIEIPDGMVLPRHPAVAEQLSADPGDAFAVLGPLVEPGQGAKLLAAIVAADMVNIAGLLAELVVGRVLNEAAAKDGGWLPEPVTP